MATKADPRGSERLKESTREADAEVEAAFKCDNRLSVLDVGQRKLICTASSFNTIRTHSKEVASDGEAFASEGCSIVERSSLQHRLHLRHRSQLEANWKPVAPVGGQRSKLETPTQRQVDASRASTKLETSKTFGMKWDRLAAVDEKTKAKVGIVAIADRDDPDAPKVLTQALWRDMRERVKAEQKNLQKQQATTVHLLSNVRLPDDAAHLLEEHPLDHSHMAQLSRLQRLLKLDKELKVLGFRGADAESKVELQPEVVAPLQRKNMRPEDRKARFSLKVPDMMSREPEDHNLPSAKHLGTESSLLAKKLQLQLLERRMQGVEHKELEHMGGGFLDDHETHEAIAQRCLIQGEHILPESTETRVRDGLGLSVRTDIGEPEPPSTQRTKALDAGTPRTFKGFASHHQAVSHPVIIPNLLRVNATHHKTAEGSNMPGRPRLSRWAQQKSLHGVVDESVAFLRSIGKKLVRLQRHHVLKADMENVCQQLDSLVDSCIAIAKQADNIADTISLAESLADEECRHLRKTRLHIFNDASPGFKERKEDSKANLHLGSPRNPKVAPSSRDSPAWLDEFWKVGVSFGKLDGLAHTEIQQARSAIDDIGSQQAALASLLEEVALEASFDQGLELASFGDVSLVNCFEDEFDEVKVTVLEQFCKILGDLAFVVFLSPDAHEVPKTVGDSMFKPRSHLHSGANVRWNYLPSLVMSYALACPVPHRETFVVATPGSPRRNKDKDKKVFMRRGVSGWTCVQVAGRGNRPPYL